MDGLSEHDFLTHGRNGPKVVKAVRIRKYSKESSSVTPAPIPSKSKDFESTYYNKEDLFVFDGDEEEDAREHVNGRTKTLAELEQLFFRCSNVMKAEKSHIQMRNLHLIMAKQILQDMDYQIKYEQKKKDVSRELWEFKHKVHSATFQRLEKSVQKQKKKQKIVNCRMSEDPDVYSVDEHLDSSVDGIIVELVVKLFVMVAVKLKILKKQ